MNLSVEHFVGTAGDFHARAIPDPAVASAWWFETVRPAIVLGSAQSDDLVRHDVCRARGIDVVRRRSGGGAVYVAEGRTLWLDVVLPNGHPHWTDDVSASALWLGELWVRALKSCGVGGLVVHSGAMVRNDLSDLVCFAGRGPGEVFRGDSKVVGISQRRTRGAARFQCAVSIDWRVSDVVDTLNLPDGSAARLRECGATLDIGTTAIRRAMSEELIDSVGLG